MNFVKRILFFIYDWWTTWRYEGEWYIENVHIGFEHFDVPEGHYFTKETKIEQ